MATAYADELIERSVAGDRTAFHYCLDLPLEEAARVLGVSPAAAKSRLYRALRRLRGHLDIQEAGT